MFQVLSTTPSANAVDVDINLNDIQIQFNEDLDPSTVNDMVISVGLADSQPFQPVTGHVELMASDTIRFVLEEALDYTARYVVVVTGGSFGVKSSTGRILGSDHLFYFTTVDAVTTGGGTTNTDPPISSITLPPALTLLSWKAEDGRVILNFNQDLPTNTVVEVSSRHPLGYPGGIDYWKDNVSYQVNGPQIILSAANISLPMEVESRLVKLPVEVVLEDHIPVIDYIKGANYLLATLDFAVNRQYSITVGTL